MGGVAKALDSPFVRVPAGLMTFGSSELLRAGVKSLVSGAPDAPAAPNFPSMSSARDTGEAGEAADRARRQARSRAAVSGRASTILTSPLGLTEPATTSKRMLLGR